MAELPQRKSAERHRVGERKRVPRRLIEAYERETNKQPEDNQRHHGASATSADGDNHGSRKRSRKNSRQGVQAHCSEKCAGTETRNHAVKPENSKPLRCQE